MVKFTVRVPDELYDRIKGAAERDRRSVNGEVVWLLEQALKASETKRK